MYKRTLQGNGCWKLLDSDENICAHKDNKQPVTVGYSENGCKYSYCPLKNKPFKITNKSV